MKKLLSILITISCVSSLAAQETLLAEKLFEPTPTALALADGGVTSPGRTASAVSNVTGKDPKSLQPGKALLLSAIMPGAGEYYSGHKIRAAAFFAVEVAAWAAVISYYNKGMNKDKEFKTFADDHFYEWVYREREYFLATTNQRDSGAYAGTVDEWNTLEWDMKIHYLPERGFTHELPDDEDRRASRSHDQQYYEMIGKYIHQFGFGWDDVFELFNGQVVGYGVGDDPTTNEYDDKEGAAKLSKHYMDMRYDSNQFLDKSSLAIQIVMLNHVASALHASFTVRTMKRQAEGKVGFRAIDYDNRKVAVGGLNFSW